MRIGIVVGLFGAVIGLGALAGAGYFAVDWFKKGAIEARTARITKAFDNLDADIKYERTSGTIEQPDFALENITIISDEKEIRAERLEVKRYDWQRPEAPHFSEIVVRGLKFKGDVFGSDIGTILAEAKFEQVTFDFFFSHEYSVETIDDPKARGGKRQLARVVVRDARLEIKGLGTLSATFEFDDWHAKSKLGARQDRELPPFIRLIGERVKLKLAEVRFRDSGFLKAYIEARASAENKPFLRARGDIVRDMQRAAREGKTTVAIALYTELIRYVERHERQPGIELTMAPEAPVELRKVHAMWLANPKGFYENMKITAKLGEAKPQEPRRREEPKRR
jgi:hypothetical protein